jgi:hypothetical protein
MRYPLILCALVALAGCDSHAAPQVAPPAHHVKIVAAKQENLESRFNIASHLMGGSSHKATTIHYLVASDSTVCEVGVGPYALAKVGQPYDCSDGWEIK